MKTFIITALLSIGVVSNNFAQKVDFAGYLASSGGVHTSTPSVVDKNGNIFVAGGTRGGLKVTSDAFQKNYKGHTKDDVTGGDAFLMKLSPAGELIYSTYIGGSKQFVMDPSVNYAKEGKLLISSMCISPDFPVTLKYAEADSTWTNCIWKYNLNGN